MTDSTQPAELSTAEIQARLTRALGAQYEVRSLLGLQGAGVVRRLLGD